MEEEDPLDLMLRVAQYNDHKTALEAAAYATGWINPRGSFLKTGFCDQEPLSRAERCRGLLELNDKSGLGVPPPLPPPAHFACSVWVHSCYAALTPYDYQGLGVALDAQGRWTFTVAGLRRHCEMAPGAIDAALHCAAADRTRQLHCQALGCSAVIDVATCTVCPLCMMGIYCAACLGKADGTRLCRVCLLFAMVKQTPIEWMFRRSQQLRCVLDRGGITPNSVDGNCYEDLIYLCAPDKARGAVYRVLRS